MTSIGFGKKLKEQRLNMGLSIQDVVEKTNIKGKYIEALEEENLAVLPGKVYTKEFLRTYSRFLNLDVNEMLVEFNKTLADGTTAKSFIKESFRTQQNPTFRINYAKLLRFTVLVLAVLVLFSVNKFWNKNPEPIAPPPDQAAISQPEKEDPKIEPDKEPPKETQNPQDSAPSAPVVDIVKLEITAARGDCWLEVVTGGKTLYYGTLKKDEEKLVFESNEEIKVVFGNAGAVDVYVNGAPLGILGETSQVVRSTFAPEP
ncbi:MAG: RodZ domain-containing protein [Bacillota bacterium]